METDKKKQVLIDLSNRIAQLKIIRSNVKSSQTIADLEGQAKKILSFVTETKSLAKLIDSISKQKGILTCIWSLKYAEDPCNMVLSNSGNPIVNNDKAVVIAKKLINSSVSIIFSSLRLGEKSIKGAIASKRGN